MIDHPGKLDVSVREEFGMATPVDAGELAKDSCAEWVPAALRRFEHEPVALGAGTRGKLGKLDLTFGGTGTETRLLRAQARVPFAVPWVLRADPHWHKLAAVYLAMPTGGIVQGDRLDLQICAEPGSVVHVTTQSATKVYAMERNFATQRFVLRVEENAYVEYWPDPLIPGRCTRYGQRAELLVAPTATLVYRDVLTAGRVARGERFVYDVLVSETVASNQCGGVLFEDVLRIEPGHSWFDPSAQFGGRDVLGSLYVLGGGYAVPELAAVLEPLVRSASGVYGGVSALPAGAGIVCRLLSYGTAPVLQTLEAARTRIRHHLGLPDATPFRK